MREQFRIADGEKLRFTADPAPRGHSIEFRINGEDPGRGFLPAPGTVTALRLPAGPGVRVDTGIEAGSVVGGNFDSLLAKVIVTGETRDRRRSSAPAARSTRWSSRAWPPRCRSTGPIVRDPAFMDEPFRVHTRWIETEWDDAVPPFAGRGRRRGRGAGAHHRRGRGGRQAARGHAAREPFGGGTADRRPARPPQPVPTGRGAKAAGAAATR